MADFKWAVKAVRDGKRVKRRGFGSSDMELGLSHGGYCIRLANGKNGREYGILLDDYLADDWYEVKVKAKVEGGKDDEK